LVHKYVVYPGSFVCHECRASVGSIRLYSEEKELTWMCRNKHLSRVSLNTKKRKTDYERKV
jgi:hypothetical protein